MNINNKIAVHRGVYFPRPEASAFSINWVPGHTTYANEWAFMASNAGGTAVVMEPITQMDLTPTLSSEVLAMQAGNIYICYQGAEEPYNKPDLTGGLAAPLDSLMVPENLYIRLRDAMITFDATKLMAWAGYTGGAITAANIGEAFLFFFDLSASTAELTLTEPVVALGDIVSPVGVITAVDTTSTPGATLVTMVC